MKVVALISGGKDSCHAMFLAQQHGHEIVALANLLPKRDQPDELNSYMYQTVGHQLVEEYATCMGLPLYRKHIQGSSSKQDMQYTPTEGDEVEDLLVLLSYVKDCIPGVGAVTSGAIASDYQRLRVEHVCARLNLVSLAYMWHQPQRQLLRSMIESELHAVLVKVAGLGLRPDRHLGKSIAQLEPHLLRLNAQYGSHVCGEGGEYESLTLDSPLFTHARIVMDASEVIVESADSMAPVAYLRPTTFHTEPKIAQHTETLGSSGPDMRRISNSNSLDMGTNGTSPSAAMLLGSPKLSKMTSWSRAHPQAALPAVHVVPDDYQPCASHHRDVSRTSVERRPGQCSVHVRLRQQADYMQITCWAVLNSQQQALSSDITENDTLVALMDILTAIQQRLREAGLQLGHALYVHLLLANMGHFAAANNMYCRTFPTTDPPSRTCVQLPLPAGVPVMLDLLVARNAFTPPLTTTSSHSHSQASPGSSFSSHVSPQISSCNMARTASLVCELPQQFVENGNGSVVSHCEKRVMHVQSISSWAPSCIGPYSQATAYEGIIYGAGAIPLQPSSMTVLAGDAAAQALCALRHVQSVSVAMRTCALRAALALTVYYCASIGPAGLEQVRQTVNGVLNDGLPTSPTTGRRRQVGPDGLELSDDDDDDENGDDGMVHEDDSLDPYLRPPAVRSCVRSNVVYVSVPGLPRGCLVEIQPMVLDCAWLEAQGPGSDSHSSTSTTNLTQTQVSNPAVLESEDEEEEVEPLSFPVSPSGPSLSMPTLSGPVAMGVVAPDALGQATSLTSTTLMQASKCAALLPDSPLTSVGSGEMAQAVCPCSPASPAQTERAANGATHALDAQAHVLSPLGNQGHVQSVDSPRDKPLQAAFKGFLGTQSEAPSGTRSAGEAGFPCSPISAAQTRRSLLSHVTHANAAAQNMLLQPQIASSALEAVEARGLQPLRSNSHTAPSQQTITALRSKSQTTKASAGGLARHVIQMNLLSLRGPHQRTLTPDSCHASVCSSLDHESVVLSPEHPFHHHQQHHNRRTYQHTESAGCASSKGSHNVMVTTVFCRQFGVLKSLYHLPADVFARPGVNKRLQLAISSVLASYGVGPEHVVQLRAWYDMHQVPEEAASQLFSDCVEGWHVNWMPALHVSTTVCEGGTAAVLELLAKPR